MEGVGGIQDTSHSQYRETEGGKKKEKTKEEWTLGQWRQFNKSQGMANFDDVIKSYSLSPFPAQKLEYYTI